MTLRLRWTEQAVAQLSAIAEQIATSCVIVIGPLLVQVGLSLTGTLRNAHRRALRNEWGYGRLVLPPTAGVPLDGRSHWALAAPHRLTSVCSR